METTNFRLKVIDSKVFDSWMVTFLPRQSRDFVGLFAREVCNICPVLEKCRPNIYVAKSGNALVSGEDRFFDECAWRNVNTLDKSTTLVEAETK